MHSSVAEFDPYQAWLRVQEAVRPLSAYQLLGLKDLETDPAAIQAAIHRQRLLLDRCKPEADDGTWERVSNELDEAVRIVLDPELKAVLDGSLRRSRRGSLNPAPSDEALRIGRGAIQCAGCGGSNPDNRRFCGSCGQALWEKCPNCGTECSCNERFCGDCGFDICQGVEQRNRDYEALLEQARQLVADHHYERALSQFRKLAAIDDIRFERWAQQALEDLANAEEQAATAKARAEQSLIAARQFLSEHAYDQAIDSLVCLPEPLRSQEVCELLQQARAAKAKLVSLNSQIREAVARKSLWKLPPLIAQSLALRPGDPPVRKLALQLSDHFAKLAKAKLAAHEYAEADEAIQQIAPFARTAEIDALGDKAKELKALTQSVSNAAVADQAALALGRKLVKSAPSNQGAQRLVNDLQQRAKNPPTDPRLAAPNGVLPSQTPIGVPADWLGHFLCVDSSRPEIANTLRKHPGQFFISLGLALQGLDEGHLPLHLTPPEKVSLLGKLSLGRLRARPASAWGLDLGNFGLKALKLVRDPKSARIQIECCEYIAHSVPLTAPSAEMERSHIQEQTLNAFLQRAKTEGSRVVVGIPGQRVLGRFFELPALPAAKLAGAIQYEAKHQLPIPLDELCWSYHKLGAGGEKEGEGQNILLAAARKAHVQDCLAPFKNVGIAVDLAQSDCLALHNAIHREFFFEAASGATDRTPSNDAIVPAALGPKDVLLLVDMGAEGTNIVFTSRDAMWFRSFGLGGNSFTNALVRQLQLTHDQAEQWKCEPARAMRFHQFHATLQPLFAQLGGELERSLASYRKLYPGHTLRHLYGVGGAFPTHGLLRQLRCGQ
jgi:type IV pilus assembly protein PilM